MVDLVRNYDAECDVMYVSLGKPDRNALSFEDEHGLIWRQSPQGQWVGVTIPDYEYFWASRKPELQRFVSARLPELVSA